VVTVEEAVCPDGEGTSEAVGPINIVFLAKALISDG